MKMDCLFLNTGKPFLYYPDFVKRFDLSVNAAVFFCYVGWKTLPGGENEWKSYTAKQVTEATGLTVREQETARKILIEKKLIEEHYARLEHVMKFRLSSIEVEIPRKRVSPNAENAGAQARETRLANSANGVSLIEQEKGKKGKETKGASAPDAVESKPKSAKPQFTDAWCLEWERRFGGPYDFKGAADGKAADELLKLYPPDELMVMAKKAWDKVATDFNCKHAITIRGFASRFNEIRLEIGAANGKATGVTAGGIDRATGRRIFQP